MSAIPNLPGTYALSLYLVRGANLDVGRLGSCHFPVGAYLYMGSARGPGGLRARLGRHLAGGGALHWYIDHLRAIAEPTGYIYVTHQRAVSMGAPLECRWSQTMLAQPGCGAPAPGFGASDCREGCLAHLVYLGSDKGDFGKWWLVGSGQLDRPEHTDNTFFPAVIDRGYEVKWGSHFLDGD